MQTVGEFLEQKRGKKKLSIEDISKTTRIHPRYIEAIDANNFSIFSSEAYVKGFIISYAKALEEDPADVLKLYYATVGGEPPSKKIFPEDTGTREIEFRKNLLFTPKIIVPVIILIIATIILFNIFSSKEEISPVDSPPTAGIPDTTEISQPNVSKEDFSQNNINVLQITAIEDTWLKVRTDTLNPQEMILKTGESKTLNAKEQFTLSVGNAGGISVKFNNDVYDSLGKRGQVIKNMVFKKK